MSILQQQQIQIANIKSLCYLFFCRPREWRKYIHDYIVNLNKNSFYLYDIHNALLAK